MYIATFRQETHSRETNRLTNYADPMILLDTASNQTLLQNMPTRVKNTLKAS